MNERDCDGSAPASSKRHPLVGKRVRLIETNDTSCGLKAGAEGTVSFVDGLDVLHVLWDAGVRKSLSLEDGDNWELT